MHVRKVALTLSPISASQILPHQVINTSNAIFFYFYFTKNQHIYIDIHGTDYKKRSSRPLILPPINV